MNSLKILQTPIRFYPYIGGVENHVYYLSKELTKLGNKVKVLCTNEPKSNKKLVDGVNVERVSYTGKITNTNISFSFPLKIFQSDFDIIHTHMPTPWTADWSVLMAKIMKKKSIITIHNDMDKSSLAGKILTKMYLYTFFKLTLHLVDRIIIVNPDWKNSFTSTKNILMKYSYKISIVPNGIDLKLFTNSSKIKKEKETILFVSILDKHHRYKGLDYLLKALSVIKKKRPNIKLLIVGEGELKNDYIIKAKKMGLQKNITFLGKIKQKDLALYYQKSSLFVLPSTEIEGFGIVLLEAMACKLPVVATDIVGLKNDIKNYHTGFIVTPQDEKSLAKSIMKLLDNHSLSRVMGNNGKKLVEKKYSWNTIALQIEDIYKKLL
jgi:glycosyltransferase involved in cell wall biosynthesis